jgi:hypothetical protein
VRGRGVHHHAHTMSPCTPSRMRTGHRAHRPAGTLLPLLERRREELGMAKGDHGEGKRAQNRVEQS